jgi:hypothetical protein
MKMSTGMVRLICAFPLEYPARDKGFWAQNEWWRVHKLESVS